MLCQSFITWRYTNWLTRGILGICSSHHHKQRLWSIVIFVIAKFGLTSGEPKQSAKLGLSMRIRKCAISDFFLPLVRRSAVVKDFKIAIQSSFRCKVNCVLTLLQSKLYTNEVQGNVRGRGSTQLFHTWIATCALVGIGVVYWSRETSATQQALCESLF